MQLQFEIRPKTMLGLHGLFAALFLLVGWIGLRSGRYMFLKVLFGPFVLVGLWLLILFLIDLAKITVRRSGAEPVMAVITKISRRDVSISSEKTGKTDWVLVVTCKSEDGRVFKEKTLKQLDYTCLGQVVPVYVSDTFSGLYMVDISSMHPSDGKTSAFAAAAEAAPPEKTADRPSMDRPRVKWFFRSQIPLLFMISLPFIAGGLFFVVVGGIELWPFLIFTLVGLIVLGIAIWRIVRCVSTYVRGDRVEATVASIAKQKEEGPYIVILRGEDRSYTIKKNFVGNVQIGSHVPVYVSRRDPDVYEADL